MTLLADEHIKIDGKLYHAEYIVPVDSSGEEDWDLFELQVDWGVADLKPITDEDGNFIPAHQCICAAHSSDECICGAWSIEIEGENIES